MKIGSHVWSSSEGFRMLTEGSRMPCKASNVPGELWRQSLWEGAALCGHGPRLHMDKIGVIHQMISWQLENFFCFSAIKMSIRISVEPNWRGVKKKRKDYETSAEWTTTVSSCKLEFHFCCSPRQYFSLTSHSNIFVIYRQTMIF